MREYNDENGKRYKTDANAAQYKIDNLPLVFFKDHIVALNTSS